MAGERGTAMVLVPTMALVVFALAGLAIDLSLVHSAHRALHRSVSAAADDAAAMIDQRHLQMTGELRVDTTAAQRIVEAHLATATLPGDLVELRTDVDAIGPDGHRDGDGGRPPDPVAVVGLDGPGRVDPGPGTSTGAGMTPDDQITIDPMPSPHGSVDDRQRVRRIVVASDELVVKSGSGRETGAAPPRGRPVAAARRRTGGRRRRGARARRPDRAGARRCRPPHTRRARPEDQRSDAEGAAATGRGGRRPARPRLVPRRDLCGARGGEPTRQRAALFAGFGSACGRRCG